MSHNQVAGVLLTEAVTLSSDPKIMKETGYSVVFQAQLQTADTPNRNGRIYSKETLESALSAPNVKEKIEHKAFYGEAGHPQGTERSRQLYIDQSNISHIVLRHWWDGEKLMGEVETAATRAGRDMMGLIKQGSEVAFSMRGLSSGMKQDGNYQRVVAPLIIGSYDWVIFPSHYGSYMVKNDIHDKVFTPQMEAADLTRQEKDDLKVLTEGTIVTLSTEDILDFITERSDNVKSLTEAMDFDITGLNQADFDRSSNILSFKKDEEVLKVFLENTIIKGIDDFILSF